MKLVGGDRPTNLLSSYLPWAMNAMR